MNLELIQLIILGLATYRLAVLLSIDTGPWHFLSRFRSLLRREAAKHPAVKRSAVATGISCLRCTSVSIAIFVAAYAQFRPLLDWWLVVAGDGFLLAMACSAAAILINRAFPEK